MVPPGIQELGEVVYVLGDAAKMREVVLGYESHAHDRASG
jgi:hypothetical protein